MEYLNVQSLMLPLATGVGFMGGFPIAPKLFQDLAKNAWFQWLMVFLLIWQGGSGQNPQLAMVTTVILFGATMALDMAYGAKEGYRQYY